MKERNEFNVWLVRSIAGNVYITSYADQSDVYGL
jgi:hypothetical protein